MESFYDIGSASDLKDIWDSDFDPSDALKLSSDSDMQDWFLERDVKMSQVILHDKLISDALLGNLPIKTEHSYSLNSDGDSMPDSPGSLQTKMEEMDDDCDQTISISASVNNLKYINDTPSIIFNQITTQSSSSSTSASSRGIKNSHYSNNMTTNCNNSSNINNSNVENNSRHLRHTGKINNNNNINAKLNSMMTTLIDSDSMPGSDIDIDDSGIKDEPISPESSCPSSPIPNSYDEANLNMINTATHTNTDHLFAHKNGSIKLSPASHQNLLKSQQIILTDTTISTLTPSIMHPQRITIPKCNIKVEPQSSVFGLPPTPPSSMPSDESEGNQSPEHHLISPMSPPNMQISTIAGITTPRSSSSSSSSSSASSSSTSSSLPSSNLNTITSAVSAVTSSTSTSITTSVSTRRSSSLHNTSVSHHTSTSTGRSSYNGTSTRQPIHTPLISSQPKGSTGTLVLTEEEKRTLLAEGYPIPTRLPLTKAEEKSLKKIRRKIKNKISAQESRRKKKEYMDQLERKVEILVSENSDYRKRVETLEDSNANLLNQLARLQTLLNKQQNFKKI